MPVTINGDGSITGLAVGGLPDGSVDADTLASNAVTTDKIANIKNTGRDCLRLLLAKVIRADSFVNFEVSPFV